MGVLRLDKESGLPDFRSYHDEMGIAFKKFKALREFYKLDRGV
jgi:hypothetical protein